MINESLDAGDSKCLSITRTTISAEVILVAAQCTYFAPRFSSKTLALYIYILLTYLQLKSGLMRYGRHSVTSR